MTASRGHGTQALVPAWRKAVAHARWELGLLLGNGEQFVLTLVIPAALLAFTRDAAVVVTASTIATMFASLAIGTGFERRSGALRFLATTPLTRTGLLAGKLLAQLTMLVLSLAVAAALGLALGVRLPDASAAATWCAAIALAAWAFAAWGLVLAGSVRAEATLALANGAFVALVALALAPVPAWLRILPGNALSAALDGTDPALMLAVLLGWAVAGTAVAARTFRWT